MASSTAATKAQTITEELRRMILAGELLRGAHIRQDELAERFAASITPVREALRILEAEGLVISEPHRGVRVAPLDIERVKGVYVMRRLLEGYAMQRATRRMSPRDIEALGAILEDGRKASADDEPMRVREHNRRFHFYFYDRCGMPALADEIHSLWHEFPWDILLSKHTRVASSHDEHEQILQAAASGDIEAVRAHTEAHIFRSFHAIAREFHLADELDDPFDIDVD